MTCDMCGKEGRMYKAEIEGVTLTVCEKCKQFGKVIGVVRAPTPGPKKLAKRPQKPIEPEVTEMVVDNYAPLIKQKREKLNLKQEELAKKVAERESLIQKIESGHFTPSISLARKLERFLNIKLIEEFEETQQQTQKKDKSEGFTLGDFIKKR